MKDVCQDQDATDLEYMRKSRFDKIRDKFSDVEPAADAIIKEAKPEDILALTLSFNTPVKVVKAEVWDEKRFAEELFC